MAKPIVALVGRPNVGKSTLFNRLIGERRAIVQNEPGTTRDRTYGTADWIGVEFTVVDTGGLMDDDEIKRSSSDSDEETRIAEETREQAYAAIAEADVIVFVTDITSGAPTAGDYEIAEVLRRASKPVILALNKADSVNRRELAYEYYDLGLGEPMPVSAYHGNGTGDMLDKVVENLPEHEEEDEELEGPKIAIVGRPNVGKSALLNALLGQERAIVSDVAGTTRDSLDTQLLWNDEPVTLIDTAGIRRRGRVEQGIERVSVMRSMRSIERADVVVLVINAEEGFTTQDLHIAGYVEEQKKGLVVALNKWDLIEKDHTTMDTFRATAARELDFMAYAPVVFISAKYQQRVHQVLDTALEVLEQRQKRVSTAALNKMLREAVDKHQPPSRPGKWIKFYYATQADVEPPTFVFFTNDPKQIHFTYRRYLENELRKVFGFEGTPIRMSFRDRHEDF
ncbi:MAG: ribosome biogenesis GTPase Der [Thermomicrobiales bacterium]|nr:ribosome biogenesis GTPase Der [Thermomicrobiales bacterium]MCO5218482.1 ribosome biogenesis GTPase Der [Thermomicrobiales bacterium]MCO5223753.1 ribosome biogenesis GTPase Der [Thermomicrobiales bacterium]MCO5228585.1 ribosome biogenesis GTPase Der [Thermomicrobiales bacterium]